jgi:hypothetical protein
VGEDIRRSGDLHGGLLAGEETIVEGKSRDDRTDHLGRPTLAIAGNDQIIGQPVEHVKRRRTTVSKRRWKDLACIGIHECRDESEVTIFGTNSPSSAMGSFFQFQITLAKRQHPMTSYSVNRRLSRPKIQNFLISIGAILIKSNQMRTNSTHNFGSSIAKA